MQLTIDYCITCNYGPVATSLAFVVKRETGLEPIINGSNTSGAFEVRLDQKLIFSKLKSNRFPDHTEIIELIKSKMR